MENKQKPIESDKVKVEKVETKPVEVKSVEPKVLKFKNVGKDMKIKLIDGKNFKWITLKTGQEVSIPRKVALRNKLVEVK